MICAYNAERTMDACLASLATLRYPHYEVVVVNDGSRDATRRLGGHRGQLRAAFTLINQQNKGLSVARNVGMRGGDAARSSPTPTPTASSIPTG